jgi:hypothetical protein
MRQRIRRSNYLPSVRLSGPALVEPYFVAIARRTLVGGDSAPMERRGGIGADCVGATIQ